MMKNQILLRLRKDSPLYFDPESNKGKDLLKNLFELSLINSTYICGKFRSISHFVEYFNLDMNDLSKLKVEMLLGKKIDLILEDVSDLSLIKDIDGINIFTYKEDLFQIKLCKCYWLSDNGILVSNDNQGDFNKVKLMLPQSEVFEKELKDWRRLLYLTSQVKYNKA